MLIATQCQYPNPNKHVQIRSFHGTYNRLNLSELYFIKELKEMPKTRTRSFCYIYAVAKNFNGVCIMSQQQIADRVGCTRQTVQRAIEDLVHLEYIQIQKRYGGRTMYLVNPLMLDPKMEGYILAISQQNKLTVNNFRTPIIVDKQDYVTSIDKGFIFKYLTRSDKRFMLDLEMTRRVLPGNARQKNESAYAFNYQKREEGIEVTSIMHKTMMIKAVEKDKTINPIRESIRNITKLKLTKAGQVMLMAFSEEAIEYANRKFTAGPTLRKPLAYFITLANEYCKAHKQTPDWTFAMKLRDTMGIPQDAPETYELPTGNPQVHQLDGSSGEPHANAFESSRNLKPMQCKWSGCPTQGKVCPRKFPTIEECEEYEKLYPGCLKTMIRGGKSETDQEAYDKVEAYCQTPEGRKFVEIFGHLNPWKQKLMGNPNAVQEACDALWKSPQETNRYEKETPYEDENSRAFIPAADQRSMFDAPNSIDNQLE